MTGIILLVKILLEICFLLNPPSVDRYPKENPPLLEISYSVVSSSVSSVLLLIFPFHRNLLFKLEFLSLGRAFLLMNICHFVRILATSMVLSNASSLKPLGNLHIIGVELISYCYEGEHQFQGLLARRQRQGCKVGIGVNLRFSSGRSSKVGANQECVRVMIQLLNIGGNGRARALEARDSKKLRPQAAVDLYTEGWMGSFCNERPGHLLGQESPEMVKPWQYYEYRMWGGGGMPDSSVQAYGWRWIVCFLLVNQNIFLNLSFPLWWRQWSLKPGCWCGNSGSSVYSPTSWARYFTSLCHWFLLQVGIFIIVLSYGSSGELSGLIRVKLLTYCLTHSE